MKKDTITGIAMLSLLLASLIVFGQSTGILSIISPPMETTLKDGTVWWHATINVDSIDDGLEFWVDSFDMKEATLDDGTEVIPITSFNIFFDKKENTCSYALIKDSQFSFFGYNLGTYYKLSNPTRAAWINVKDGKNNVLKVLDATTEGELVFKDLYDGEGEVIVKPQGILSGSKDCPEYSNVVVVFKNEEPIYYDRIDFNQKREDFSITTITSFAKMKEFLFNFLLTVDTADSFTKEFKNLQASEYNKEVTGEISKLGSGVITVAISADFVDAVRFAPAEDVMPKITKITTIDKIQTGKSGTLRVTIENEKDNTGIVGVTPSADFISFIPTSRQVTLGDKVFVDFSFETGKIIRDTVTDICVDAVSSGSQFTGSNRDRLCKQITITPEPNEDEKICGDGICQEDIGETYLSCPADCTGLNPCVDIPNSSPNWLGKCICIEGYHPVIEAGQMSCKADTDYTGLLILLGVSFIAIFIAITFIVIMLELRRK